MADAPHSEVPQARVLQQFFPDGQFDQQVFDDNFQIYSRFQHFTAKLVAHAFSDIVTSPADENLLGSLDPHQPVIFAPNHRDFTDIPLVGIVLGRHGITDPHYIAKQELFEQPIVSWILRRFGGIPVDREHPNIGLLRPMVSRVLNDYKRPLVLFPEGTRHYGDENLPLDKGAAYFAVRNNVSIVPVGIYGTEGALKQRVKKGKRVGRVAVTFGQPIPPEIGLRNVHNQLTGSLQEQYFRAKSNAGRRRSR